MTHFHVGRVEEAADLVLQHHYSRRVPANIQVCGTWHDSGGLFGDAGEATAACILALPPTRWAEPVLELVRLVRSPNHSAPLTGLISATAAHARAAGFDLLVSFADRTHGHHGGIYQAASWAYDGQRDRQNDGVMWNGAFIPGRSCNSRWGTRSPSKLAEMLPGHSIEAHFDEGKHLYWRALNRSGQKKAARLGLKSVAYPKPAVAA